MKNNLLSYSYFLILSIFISCVHTPSSINKVLEVNLPQEQILKIDLDEAQAIYPISSSSIFDSVSYIKLETNPECMIGSIAKVIYIDNKFIIMDGGGERPVLVFSNRGDFLNKIGECGHGPKEYIRPSDISYDQFNNELLVWSSYDQKILRYRIDGEFVSSIRLDFWIDNIAAYNKDMMIGYVNNIKQGMGYGKNYHFHFFDKDGKTVSKLDEYNTEKDIFTGVSTRSITSYNNDILFNFPSTNEIFKLSPDSIELKYYIDYGIHNIHHDFFIGKTMREATKEISNLDLGTVLFFSETDSHFYVQSFYNKVWMHTLFERSTQNRVSFSFLINNERYLLYPAPAITTIVGNQLIGFCESQSFEITKDIYSKLQSDTTGQNIRKVVLERYRRGPEGIFKERLIKTVENMHFNYNPADVDFVYGIESDDNPLIFIGTVRENF